MEDIEKQLRKQAEILGDLNMELNKYIEDNQRTSLDISKLEERIAKKKKIMEQENKDKAIIHEKLIKAQQRKQKLEIEYGDKKPEPTRQQPTPAEPEIKRPQFLNRPKKQEKEPVPVPSQEEQYGNSEKGEYQPPLMPMLDNSDGEDEEDEDEEKVMESFRKKMESLQDGDDGDDQ